MWLRYPRLRGGVYSCPDAAMIEARHADQVVVGWREWVALPDLGIDSIKAKIDTGARTSALHGFSLDVATERGVRVARFGVHPIQHDGDTVVWCSAPVIDERNVRDSGGRREWRFVIETPLRMGPIERPVELTLTGRDTMLFRMLVGRTALAGLYVDPSISYATGANPMQ